MSSLAGFAVSVDLMDHIVDALNNAYWDFVSALASVLEAEKGSGAQKIAATYAAIENFKLH